MSDNYYSFYCPYCRSTSYNVTNYSRWCEKCGNLLFQREGFFATHPYAMFQPSKVLLAEEQKRAEKTIQDANDFIEKLQENKVETDIILNCEAIGNNRDYIINYLRAQLNAEVRFYELSRIYQEICQRLRVAEEIQLFNSEAAKEVADDGVFKKLVDKKMLADGVTPPSKPVEPVFNAEQFPAPQPPAEPVYEKRGLFNKKAVQKRNEEKRLAFEKENADYNAACRARLLEMENKRKIHDEAKARYDEEMQTYALNLDNYKKKWKREYNKEIKKIIPSAVSSMPNQRRFDFLTEQKRTVETMLEEAASIRSALFNSNVLYPKYRTLIAEANFLEYLESGRCDSLTGESGAYNLYESEIRAGVINPLLEQLLLSMETIKLSQTVLYNILDDVSVFVDDAMKKLDDTLEEFTTKQSNTQLAERWYKAEIRGKAHSSLVPTTAEAKLGEFITMLQERREKNNEELQKLTDTLPKK